MHQFRPEFKSCMSHFDMHYQRLCCYRNDLVWRMVSQFAAAAAHIEGKTCVKQHETLHLHFNQALQWASLFPQELASLFRAIPSSQSAATEGLCAQLQPGLWAAPAWCPDGSGTDRRLWDLLCHHSAPAVPKDTWCVCLPGSAGLEKRI